MKTRHPLRIAVIQLLLPLSLAFTLSSAHAGSATWNLNPTNGSWDTVTNWTPNTVPNQITDTATFDVSNITTIAMSDESVGSMVFNPGASAYAFIAPVTDFLSGFTIGGVGVMNNSGVTQNFLIMEGLGEGSAGSLIFDGDATAGSNTVYTINGSDFSDFFAGQLIFKDNSSAATATIIVDKNGPNGQVGACLFQGTSTAANATFFNSGYISFQSVSDCGDATFINEGASAVGELGGLIDISAQPTSHAIFINNAGGGARRARCQLVFLWL
jgi:hypothetical protein